MFQSRKNKSDILLESLSKNEIKSFDGFLNYRLKEKSKDVLRYWKSRYSSEQNILRPEESKSFSRKTLSDFNKQLERYFIYKNLDRDPFSGTVFLIRELRYRNIEKYFEKLLNDLKTYQNHKFGKGYQNTLGLLKLNFEEYMLHNSRIDFKMLVKTSKSRIELSEIIISYGKLFEYYNDVYFSESNKHEDSGLISIKDVAVYVKAKESYFKKFYPNVWTLYLIYDIVENSYDREKIISAFKYFGENEKNFTSEFLQIGYDALFKLVFTILNSGNKEVYEDLYRILRDLESRGVFSKLHHFPPRIFLGFISISLNSGNIALADRLLKQYSNKIILSLRNIVVNISKAMIELEKGNYNLVKSLLENVKPNDSMLYIFTKTTLLKAYYEKDEFRNIYPLIDTIKHFIHRRKETREINKSLLLFLKYLSKLSQVKKNNGKGLNVIESNFSKEIYFFQKKWISIKILQLTK